jgi:ribosome-associated protein
MKPLAPPPYSTDRAILEQEVIVEVFRASGPGGQHVNKTESALRLKHPPSGVLVIAQDSPSQHRNRETAFARLIEKLEKLNYVKPKRHKTRPTLSSVKKRLESKTKRSTVKTGRSKRVAHDD